MGLVALRSIDTCQHRYYFSGGLWCSLRSSSTFAHELRCVRKSDWLAREMLFVTLFLLIPLIRCAKDFYLIALMYPLLMDYKNN